MTSATLYPPRFSDDNACVRGLLPLLKRIDVLLETALLSHANVEDDQSYEDETTLSMALVGMSDASQAQSQNDGLQPQGHQKNAQVSDQLGLEPHTPFAWLQQTFGLSLIELEVLMLALAPELSLRYEKLYAYLQDDALCLRPTVDLALRLFCTTVSEQFAKRRVFSSAGPLRRHGLLQLVAKGDRPKSTLLTQELHVADPVMRLLLGQQGLEPALNRYCEWHFQLTTDQSLVETESAWSGLKKMVATAWETQHPFRLYIQSADRDRIQLLVKALAAHVKIPIISADISHLVREKVALSPLLKQMARSAYFQTALLYLDNLDELQVPEHQHLYQQVWSAIAQHPGLTVLSGSQPYGVIPHNRVAVMTIPLPQLTVAQRRSCWQQSLTQSGVVLEAPAITQLSDRYKLTPSQIENSVDTACKMAQLQDKPPALADLLAAARAQSGRELTIHAQKVETPYGWDDLVLPVETKKQLRDLCAQAQYNTLVQDTWGFAQKLALGRGITALFVGPPGTGKTMAAGVIAQVLALDLYKIDLSQVVSKYIGETEKSLNRIFEAATNANAVLLFDEADALFGKRTEVKDSHDRYANIETSYLLQKMEEYEGIAILTTNLQGNMDNAFVRRLRAIVAFSMPEVGERQLMWRKIWPAALPLAADIDLDFLAKNLEISGAVIRNIALQAAYLAAAEEVKVVGMAHVISAVQREFQKMGKILMREDLNPHVDLY